MNLILASRRAKFKTRINALFKLVSGNWHAVRGGLHENVPWSLDIAVQQAEFSLGLTDIRKLGIETIYCSAKTEAQLDWA